MVEGKRGLPLWPFAAAKCRAVFPLLSVEVTSDGHDAKISTSHSSSPVRANSQLVLDIWMITSVEKVFEDFIFFGDLGCFFSCGHFWRDGTRGGGSAKFGDMEFSVHFGMVLSTYI